jgi:hypothetical protein
MPRRAAVNMFGSSDSLRGKHSSEPRAKCNERSSLHSNLHGRVHFVNRKGSSAIELAVQVRQATNQGIEEGGRRHLAQLPLLSADSRDCGRISEKPTKYKQQSAETCLG